MRPSPPSNSSDACRRRRVRPLRFVLAALAGVAGALLVSCGSSGKALIPIAHAGPLVSDFEAVRNAAENANGDCSSTEAALRKTEEDFATLPATVDAGLRSNLRQGIENLRVRAHEMCIQPLSQATSATTSTEKTATSTTTSTPTTTTSTETQPKTTPTQTSPTTSTPTNTSPGGGTPAPGQGEAAPGGAGEPGAGVGQNGGAAPGEAGAGGQENGK